MGYRLTEKGEKWLENDKDLGWGGIRWRLLYGIGGGEGILDIVTESLRDFREPGDSSEHIVGLILEEVERLEKEGYIEVV